MEEDNTREDVNLELIFVDEAYRIGVLEQLRDKQSFIKGKFHGVDVKIARNNKSIEVYSDVITENGKNQVQRLKEELNR